MPLDFRDQKFGCEIEMTGITRQQAAEAVAALFGTPARQTHESRIYDPWETIDNEGKKWRFVFDGSIQATQRVGRRQEPARDSAYKVELNSPVLEYAEMGKLQDVVRVLRHAGAVVNPSCGLHVHVDAANHTPRSLRNLLSIMYSKEDLILKALGTQPRRVQQYCHLSRENVLKVIRNMPPSLTMEQLRRAWYEGRDGAHDHYNWSRYYALNLHSVFYHGTVEWRCFESTLHAGEVRADITLALAMSAQAINLEKTVARKTPVGDNPAFAFRTFLLRLAKYTNVDTQARIIDYDIRELGEQLMPLGMLVTLDAIYNRVIQNQKRGKRTWIVADEFYILFRYEYSANFFYKLWKRIRKYNGLITGLTQNVDELLRSDTARLMLANSEFLILLNQSATDREELAKLLHISDTQLGYITDVPAGCGLIRCGGQLVPFTNAFPQNTDLYRLMSTRPGEMLN